MVSICGCILRVYRVNVNLLLLLVQFDRYVMAFSYNLLAIVYLSFFRNSVALSLTNLACAKLCSSSNFHDCGSLVDFFKGEHDYLLESNKINE